MSGLTVSAAQMTDNVCRTEVCIRTANSILEYIDFNVDPCQDFYQYACKYKISAPFLKKLCHRANKNQVEVGLRTQQSPKTKPVS